MSDPIPLPKVRNFDGHDWFITKTYRRNLPHWELKGSTYFITAKVSDKLGRPFENSKLAGLMIESLDRYDQKKYVLHCYVIMPDHLHLIMKPFVGNSLAEIMHHLKGSSAYAINKALNRSGKFWQKENFDHLIRNELDLRSKWEYIRENPVKARLVLNSEDYPYSSFYREVQA